MSSRRRFLRQTTLVGAGAAFPPPAPNAIVIDPKPLFDISPYLYMQFMEPLGVADASVEACWDYDSDDWRKDFVAVVKDLAPGVIRWGGLYSRYYKWREGVGPVASRPRLRNWVWGGYETNRVGTHEFVDLCRRVGAEPLYCVNFLSDGVRRYWKTASGDNRTGDAAEAADWVAYANDPDHAERKRHGVSQPYNIKLWQLGNETSYGQNSFSRDQAIAHTIEFAKAMRARDPSIQLIGWGDRGGKPDRGLWAEEMLRRAGEHLNYIAIHLMQSPGRPDTILPGMRYQQNPEQAWQELLEISNRLENRVTELEQVIDSQKATAGIAVTEGHLSIPPRTNPILCEWLSAGYHARSMNIYQRHGAKVKIATGADFAGARWTVNAVMLQVPRGISYLLPVGSIMRLFSRHNGKQGVAVKAAPAGLDIAASRAGGRVLLHVANLEYRRSVEATFVVEGMNIAGGRVFEIAPENARLWVGEDQPDVFVPKEKVIAPGSAWTWRFPATSVSAVELSLAV